MIKFSQLDKDILATTADVSRQHPLEKF